jgi:hypothetical protein
MAIYYASVVMVETLLLEIYKEFSSVVPQDKQ